jgi:GT2 family glycosyltransferase
MLDVERRAADTFQGPPAHEKRQSTVTVAVCSRERTEDLAVCLQAIGELEYPDIDVLVVDNAPSSEATRRLMEDRFPQFRYVREPRPGLDWARNRAIRETKGEILAFTDDDAVVDPGWVSALVSVFDENEDVMAVTGLVIPLELETEAQILFEEYGGFGKGFLRRWYQALPSDSWHLSAGWFGTGTNMAFRRSIFNDIGEFDPALDVGTRTNGGGDLEMFFRLLEEGHLLVYEPAAIVRHRHRRTRGELKTQLRNHGIGFFSYLMRTARVYPAQRIGILRLAVWWLARWGIGRLLRSFVQPRGFPRDLIVAELLGALVGLTRYPRALREARRVAVAYEEPA